MTYKHAFVVENNTKAASLNRYLNDDAIAFAYGTCLAGRGFMGYTLLSPPTTGEEENAIKWVKHSLNLCLIPDRENVDPLRVSTQRECQRNEKTKIYHQHFTWTGGRHRTRYRCRSCCL